MGYVVTQDAAVVCPHAGSVRFITSGAARMKIRGSDVVSRDDQAIVEGCAGGTAGDPCIRVEWIVPGHPVLTVDDKPVLTTDTPGTCITVGALPAGPPTFATFQTVVEA